MGLFGGMSRSSQGPKRSVLDASSPAILLPVFRSPIFMNHNVRNWIQIPNGKGGLFGSRDYPGGTDGDGWGLHLNGVVDCINVPLCREFSMNSMTSDNNWPILWDLEATWKERLIADQGDGGRAVAHWMLLRRLIVLVEIANTGIRPPKFEEWPKMAVSVSLDLNQTSVRDGVSGDLTRRSSMAVEESALRAKRFVEFSDARRE